MLQDYFSAKFVVIVAAEGVLESQDLVVPGEKLQLEQEFTEQVLFSAVRKPNQFVPRLFPIVVEVKPRCKYLLSYLPILVRHSITAGRINLRPPPRISCLQFV